MDTRQVIDESVGPYSLSASFNSDNSCFSVGLDTGFCGKSWLPVIKSIGKICVAKPAQLNFDRSTTVFNANPCELKVSRGTYHPPLKIAPFLTFLFFMTMQISMLE